ncbi:hypothetical protein D3C84_1078170 [compost metagenome]
MVSGSPLAGLRPWRSARLTGSKVPKPTRAILSPAATVSCTVLMKALSMSFTAVWLWPDFSATALTSSWRFIEGSFWLVRYFPALKASSA